MSEFPIGKWHVEAMDIPHETLELEFTEAGALTGSLTRGSWKRTLEGVWAETQEDVRTIDIAAKLSNGIAFTRTLSPTGKDGQYQDLMGVVWRFRKKEDNEFPVGKWRITVKDAYNTRMEFEFEESGEFQGTQTSRTIVANVRGEWTLSKNGNRLDLKGKVGIQGRIPDLFAEFEMELEKRAERAFVNRADPFESLYVFEPVEAR